MSVELMVSLSAIATFVISATLMVWRFASMTTEFRTAIAHLEKQIDRAGLGDIPLLNQRLASVERLLSGYPQAVQNISLLQAQVNNAQRSIRGMRAIREGSRPDIEDEDDK